MVDFVSHQSLIEHSPLQTGEFLRMRNARVCLHILVFVEAVTSSTPPPPAGQEDAFSLDQQVGQRIRSAREARELTQGAVSTRTRMIDSLKKGISRTALVGYESGSSRPGLREIRLICEVLQVTPNWIVYGSDTPFETSLPSLALVRTAAPLRDAVRLGFAIAALKGHERDALSSLVLSLAGRQLGDLRLSGLLTFVGLVGDDIDRVIQQWLPDDAHPESLEELMDVLSDGFRSNMGTKLILDEDSDRDEARGEWTYLDQKVEKPNK